MERIARLSPVIPAVLAAVVLVAVIANGVSTVLDLRTHGVTTYPLVSPLNMVPASLIACSFFMLAKERRGAATALGMIALVTSCLFWISQASGRLG